MNEIAINIKEFLKQKKRTTNLILSLYYWLGMILITIVYSIIAAPYIITKNEEKVHKFAIRWARTILKFSKIQIEVYNKEMIYTAGPSIIISNHQSLFDIFIFYSFLDISFRWMAKKSLFSIPIIGPSMKAAGYIPVEREDKKKAMQSMFEAAEQIRNGKSVIIFPEGTRGKIDGKLLPFKKGSFILAKKANVVLQPIVIWGSQYIIPVDRIRKIPRIYPGKVWAMVCNPVYPDEYKNMSVDELSDHIRNILEAHIEILKKKELEELQT
ncbi:MAG: 1-acyl-sn-glycerol-3-phosphate acyltransferase [Leptospiraceae bacterium]|nr:1-acyl-sn-glycerol-3-phosphate acyltransferase [Leptospiraceae bacterium]MDW7976312.1 lysophospholipid acyltransferase family protein [Leptospiraceae bacterium]